MEILTKQQVIEKLKDYRLNSFCEVQIEPDIEKLKWHSGRVNAFDIALTLIDRMEG